MVGESNIKTDRELLKDFRVLLEDNRFYIIAAAIRGPDSLNPGSEALKEITTRVIRYYSIYASTGYLSQTCTFEGAKITWNNMPIEYQNQIKFMWREEKHFRAHIKDALLSLHELGIIGAKDYLLWLKDTLE